MRIRSEILLYQLLQHGRRQPTLFGENVRLAHEEVQACSEEIAGGLQQESFAGVGGNVDDVAGDDAFKEGLDGADGLGRTGYGDEETSCLGDGRGAEDGSGDEGGAGQVEAFGYCGGGVWVDGCGVDDDFVHEGGFA